MSGAFQDVVDQQDAQSVELSENVAADFIQYFRGNVVGHEEEGLLMYFAMASGWSFEDSCHTNVLGMGPPGSGKSLTKNTVEELYDDRDTYTKTDASSNAILDSVEWDVALVAPLDEYDKVNRDIIEVLKSSNPEDGGYAKDRNVEDPDARGGYSPTEVSAEANPWVLLYAPSSKKGGINDELEDRALVLYFSNSKHTRRGIGRKEFGHEDIDIAGPSSNHEFIYDTHALAAALREHVRDLPVERHFEEDDDGNDHLVARSGGTPTYMPSWVWYAVEPIFNVDEDYTNRVYGIVNNLIRGSAILNHEHRPRKDVEMYVDEDSTETETREAVVVGPQDVANVLSCLPTLLSTTHQLTPIKRHILDAVDATEPMTDGDGTTVQDVRDWLDENDIPHPSEGTLRQKMNELAENYYLHKWENAGGKKGNANVYEKRDEGALQTPNVYDLQRQADMAGDDVELADDDCVDIDPEDPFDTCTDPIRDKSFHETVSEFEAQFSGSEVSTDAANYMGGPSDSDGSSSGEVSGNSTSSSSTTPSSNISDDSSGGQASLGDVTDGGGVDEDAVDDTDGGEDPSADVDPEGSVDNPTEQYVYENLVTDQPFGHADNVVNFVGIAGPGGSEHDVDTGGTPLSPDHELWQDRPDMTDDRIVSGADCLRELDDAYASLREKRLVVEDYSQGPPAMMCLVKTGE